MEAVALPPHLTQDEIDDMCKPLKQPAAQIRYLRNELHLQVDRKPGGQPLVWRVNVEAVKGPAAAGRAPAAAQSAGEPDMGALQAHLAQKVAARKRSHGTKAH